MEGIGGRIRTVLAPINNDATTGDGFLGFGVAHFGNGDRGGDTHDRGCDKVLGGNAEADVCEQDRTGDGGETRGHCQMDLGVGHDIEVGLDKTSRFPHTNERGGSSNNGFGTRNPHGLGEEPSAGQQDQT